MFRLFVSDPIGLLVYVAVFGASIWLMKNCLERRRFIFNNPKSFVIWGVLSAVLLTTLLSVRYFETPEGDARPIDFVLLRDRVYEWYKHIDLLEFLQSLGPRRINLELFSYLFAQIAALLGNIYVAFTLVNAVTVSAFLLALFKLKLPKTQSLLVMAFYLLTILPANSANSRQIMAMSFIFLAVSFLLNSRKYKAPKYIGAVILAGLSHVSGFLAGMFVAGLYVFSKYVRSGKKSVAIAMVSSAILAVFMPAIMTVILTALVKIPVFNEYENYLGRTVTPSGRFFYAGMIGYVVICLLTIGGRALVKMRRNDLFVFLLAMAACIFSFPATQIEILPRIGFYLWLFLPIFFLGMSGRVSAGRRNILHAMTFAYSVGYFILNFYFINNGLLFPLKTFLGAEG